MEVSRNAQQSTLNVAVPVSNGQPSKSDAPLVRSLRGFSDSGVSLRIPTNADANEHVHEIHGKESWQAKALHVLHSNTLQTTLMALLLLDVMILFTELFLSASHPVCTTIVRDAISCCPSPDGAVDHSANRWLAEDSHHGLCEAPLVDTNYTASCDPHKYPGVHTTEEALFWVTISILSIFLIELGVLMAALTPCVFCRQIFYVLDLFIISVSLCFELVFHFIDNTLLSEYLGLLIIARLWRFVRIGHGLIEVTAEYSSKRYEKIRKLAEDMESLIEHHDAQLSGSPDYERLKVKSKELLGTIDEAEEDAGEEKDDVE